MPHISSYDEEAKARLWSHRLHEDLVLAERQNFFLVAQSLLIVAYAELLNGKQEIATISLSVAGILLTAAWLWVNRRQNAIVDHVQARAKGALPEFADTYRARPIARPRSTVVMIGLVPGLLGLVWVVFLVLAVWRGTPS